MNQQPDPKKNPDASDELNSAETKHTSADPSDTSEDASVEATPTRKDEETKVTNDHTTDTTSTNSATDTSMTSPEAEEGDTRTDATAAGSTSSAPQETQKDATSSMTGIIVGAIVLALLMIGGVWYFVSGTNVNSTDDATANATAGQGQATLPGLEEGNPDDPVAEVNGETLLRSEYNRIRRQLAGTAQQQGLNLTASSTVEQINSQAIETLVNTELIRQAAEAAGSSVTEQEVDERFTEIVEQVGGADALSSSLEELGLSEAELRSDVEQELLIQGYVESEVGTEELTASDEEVNTLYEEAGGAEAGLPPLEEVRPQIEQQVISTKEQEAISSLVDGLREEADVEILI
jgi:peptidyl-prolyl cis-trans isomerase SurA